MSLKHSVYIDEAGNTGDDLKNQDQPFFTIGAIGIPESAASSIESSISALRKQYKLQSTQELKSKSLLGTKNEPILSDIFNLLFEKMCLPFFTIVEKKFMIVGRTIEDLFDPEYNDNTDNSWTYPSELKTEIANFLYNHLSENTLLHCATAFQQGQLIDIQQAYNEILVDVRGKHFRFDVEKVLVGAQLHLENLSKDKIDAEAVFKKNFGSSSGVFNSPNLTTYFGLLSRIEDFYRQTDVDEVSVIFDSSRQFNAAFANLFISFGNSPQNKIILPNGQSIVFGFAKLKTFRDEDSKNNVFLQLSDLLTSSINQFFIKLVTANSTTQFTEVEVFLIGIIYMLLDERLGDWVVSTKLKHKFGRIFVSEGAKLQNQSPK